MSADAMSSGAEVTLLVFAKAPIPGKVKTRLMPALDAEQARDVHVALLERTLEVACQAFPAARDSQAGWRRAIRCSKRWRRDMASRCTPSRRGISGSACTPPCPPSAARRC